MKRIYADQNKNKLLLSLSAEIRKIRVHPRPIAFYVGTGAWRTAANSIASPPARLSAPPTPVDIHSDRLAAFTMASTSRSQMSPFQSSMRAKAILSAR